MTIACLCTTGYSGTDVCALLFGADGAIRVPIKEDVQERGLTIRIHLHSKLAVGVYNVLVLVEGVNMIQGQGCNVSFTYLIQKRAGVWKVHLFTVFTDQIGHNNWHQWHSRRFVDLSVDLALKHQTGCIQAEAKEVTYVVHAEDGSFSLWAWGLFPTWVMCHLDCMNSRHTWAKRPH